MRHEPLLDGPEAEYRWVDAHEHRASAGHKLDEALRRFGAPHRVSAEHLVERVELGEHSTVAAGQQPHAKAATVTPAASSAVRTARANSTDPGVSP